MKKVSAPVVMLFNENTIEYREIQTIERQISFGGYGPFRLYEVLSLVEELENSDGIFSTVIIYDDDLRKAFENLEVCETDGNRGGSYRGKNRKKFEKFLMTLVYESEKLM